VFAAAQEEPALSVARGEAGSGAALSAASLWRALFPKARVECCVTFTSREGAEGSSGPAALPEARRRRRDAYGAPSDAGQQLAETLRGVRLCSGRWTRWPVPSGAHGSGADVALLGHGEWQELAKGRCPRDLLNGSSVAASSSPSVVTASDVLQQRALLILAFGVFS